MKQPLMLTPGLKEFHWEDLANLHVELSYARDRFIRTVNEKVSSQCLGSIEELDQLARVDELLKAASDALEQAKSVLFNVCYEGAENR